MSQMMKKVIPKVRELQKGWSTEYNEFINQLIELYENVDESIELEKRYEPIYKHCQNPTFIHDIDDGLERLYECVRTDKKVVKTYYPTTWNGKSLEITYLPMPIDDFMVAIFIASYISTKKANCDMTFCDVADNVGYFELIYDMIVIQIFSDTIVVENYGKREDKSFAYDEFDIFLNTLSFIYLEN